MRKWVVVPAIVMLATASATLAGDQSVETPTPTGTMHVERVEPGVLRVLHDGAGHDLTDFDTFEDRKPVSLLAAGDGGSVWMTSSGGFIEIGVPGEVPDPLDTFLAQMEVGPDGALWVADRQPMGSTIGRWQHGAWTFHDLPAGAWVVWLDAQEDGSLEIAWRDESILSIGLLQPGDDQATVSPVPSLPLISPDGQVVVQRTPDGQLWVAEGPWWQRGQRFEPAPLWRFDGAVWQAETPLADAPVQPRALRVERAGTLLVSWLEVVGTSRLEPGLLTRLQDDGSWTAVSVVEDEANERGGLCRGYYELEGETLTRYLDGICVRPAAVAPTGEVWVFGHDQARKDPAVYVITPER